MPTLRRIGPAPLSDKDAASRLRESLFGKVYIKYLKRFLTFRLLAQWLWRNGFPIYVKYSTLSFAKLIPIIKLSAYAERTPEGVQRLAEAETVDTPSPRVIDRHEVRLVEIMPTLRRIGPAPLSDKDAASRLRESLFGKVYIKYLKRFLTFRLLAQWLWRNGFPIYVKYSTLSFAKLIPIIKLSAYAERTPEGVQRLAEAETVDTPSPAVFPAKDQDYLVAPHDRYVFPDMFVTTVHEALVTGETNLILTGKEVLCHDLYDFRRDYTSEELHGRIVINPKTMRVRWLVNDAAPESVPVAAAFVDACALNYAHWMTEVLPRICLFCSEDRFRDVPIVVNDGMHQNLMESLFMVAGQGRKIITLPTGRALRVERLFAVSPAGYVPFERRTNKLSGHSHGVFSPFALNFLVKKIRNSFGSNNNCLPKKIVIRRNSGVRLVVNAADIEKQLLDRRFSVIEPEKLKFSEQVQLFSQAEIIVGATGASFANIVFCKPSAQIVIMISKHESMPYWYWQNIVRSVGCRVNYVLGDIVRASDLGIHGDFRVNPMDVLDAIE